MKFVKSTFETLFNGNEAVRWFRNGLFGAFGFAVATPVMDGVQHLYTLAMRSF